VIVRLYRGLLTSIMSQRAIDHHGWRIAFWDEENAEMQK
jgi:hypothetical protein